MSKAFKSRSDSDPGKPGSELPSLLKSKKSDSGGDEGERDGSFDRHSFILKAVIIYTILIFLGSTGMNLAPLFFQIP